MPRNLANSALMKPFAVLAFPGMYLFYKYNQYKRQQQENNRKKVTERELAHLNHKIDKLLTKLDEHEMEIASTQEEECVICCVAKATMQTYPCGHRVVCRKCFVKTIQVAVSQRLLPLRCVICREKILRLKQTHHSRAPGTKLPTSVSQYSIGGLREWDVPQSSSLYSVSSRTSNISGLSNLSSVSSVSSASTSSYKSRVRFAEPLICPSPPPRSPEPLIRIKEKSPSRPLLLNKPLVSAIKVQPAEPRWSHTKENRNEIPRLPPIKEFQREFQKDFRAAKDKPCKDKSYRSTRIRCAQKLVNQLEKQPSAMRVASDLQVKLGQARGVKNENLPKGNNTEKCHSGEGEEKPVE